MNSFDPSQYTQNESFYETAWEARRQLMQKIIEEEGERHPLRVIGKFLHHNRYHEFSVVNNQPHFAKKQLVEMKNVVFNEKGMNVDQKGYPTGLGVHKIMPFNDKHLQIPFYYNKDVAAFIIDFLGRIPPVDAVIELGSGFAENLVTLYYHGGPRVPYYAGDFTESGTKCAQMLADLDPDMKLRPFRFDYKNADLSAVKEKGRVFIFTSHSIEQVENIPSDLFSRLTTVAREVVGLHLEPFGQQFQTSDIPNDVDRHTLDYFAKMKWNQNLFRVLASSHVKGNIVLDHIGKNVMGGDVANPTSVAVWHKFVPNSAT